MTGYRPFATAALFLAVVFLPYWAYVPLIVAGALLLPFYWEAIILGFAIDTLYGTRGFFPAALAAAALVALFIPLRERLRLIS
jgi:hypothetical protein